MQNIIQDPNGPLIRDRIDDALIAASRRVPIDLHTNAAQWDHADELLERIARGRFIVRVHVETLEEARRWVAKVRKLSG